MERRGAGFSAEGGRGIKGGKESVGWGSGWGSDCGMESGRAQGAHRARAGRQQQMAATERGHRPREKAEGRPVAEGKGRDFEAADGGHRAAAREQEDSGERERESRERDGRCAGSSAGRADDARAVRRVMVPAEETFGASRTR